jgi:hypothetical protein
MQQGGYRIEFMPLCYGSHKKMKISHGIYAL